MNGNSSIIGKENMDKVQEILTCYRTKPNVPYRHIECTVAGHHVDFTYKSWHNYANAVSTTIRRYRLYIGTKKSSEDDLRRLL